MKIRRIVAAVDASPHSIAALEAAAELAETYQAELTGIFVEDVDLIRLAGLPFAREMIYPLALGRHIEVPLMEERLRELAETAREVVSQNALDAGVHWHFVVRRGTVLPELLKALNEADMMVIGKASNIERKRRVRLGTIAANLLARGTRPVLALQYGEMLQGPAMIVYDGSPDSIGNLATASGFARLLEGRPIILLLAKTREEAVSIEKNVETKLGVQNVAYRHCSRDEAGGLVRLAHEEEAGIVILTGHPSTIAPEELPETLDKIDCPILVCRQPAQTES